MRNYRKPMLFIIVLLITNFLKIRIFILYCVEEEERRTRETPPGKELNLEAKTRTIFWRSSCLGGKQRGR